MVGDPLDINTVIGVAIGYLVALALRQLGKTRFWSQIRERARNVLEDPRVPVDDPREAAERALLEAQRPKVDEVARSLAPHADEKPSA
jgi:hypothetical protein